MTKRQIAWLAIPIIIVLAIGLTLVAAGSDDPANGPRAFEIGLAEGESQVIDVAPAGTVTLTRTRSHLEIEDVDANPGYRSRIRVAKAAGQHVVADFTGEGRRFTVTALLYEGRVRIAIDQQPISEPIAIPTTTSSTTTRTATTAPPTTTLPATTAPPTTAPPTTAPTSTAPPTTAPPTTAPTTTAPPTTAPPTSTTTSPPTTTTLIPKLPDGEVTYSLGPAGTVKVTFRDGEFDEVNLDLDGGWRLEKDQAGPDQIDLLLEKGVQRVIWQAYIDKGEVVINLQVIEDNVG